MPFALVLLVVFVLTTTIPAPIAAKMHARRALPAPAKCFLLSVAAEFLKAPYPAWTPVGVTELWPPEAVVEIRCVAVVANRGQVDSCARARTDRHQFIPFASRPRRLLK